MSQDATFPVCYGVDADDRLIDLGHAWDEFARNQGSEHLTSEHVLGTQLWDHISDPTTIQIYEALFARARQQGKLQASLRCDAPECRRLLSLTIEPLGEGKLRLISQLVNLELRDAVPWPLGTRRSDLAELLRMCGWCNRLAVGQRWEEMEVACGELRLLEHASLPRVSHGICENCYDRMMRQLAS